MRILLVEDEPQIADFIRRGLAENGYSVDVAADGEEALGWPAVADFDVIILDIMLPLVDGIQVCRSLRDEERAHARTHAHSPRRRGRPRAWPRQRSR